ncbi:hypothetical protein [Lonepinella sp. MS14436]|uniref:hypothetical protein n=1 Tax=Lonepinella sp. MS14436 TaxID=3003619 RepID=UPI0036DBA085
MKTKLTDLTEHLFLALERLNDDDLTPEQMSLEIKRANSVSNVADKITTVAQLSLDAAKFLDDKGDIYATLPPIFDDKHKLALGEKK